VVSRYLVTGCAGFIGSNVCGQLLAAGHEVFGVDNLNAAYDPRLKDWRLNQLRPQAGFQFAECDISERDAVAAALTAHGLTPAASRAPALDAVFNLAARAGVRASVEDPWTYYHTNVIGTINMLELCRAWRIPKFVVASSSSVYGDSTAVPYREDQPVGRPISPYAASKQATETISYAYHHLHGIDVSALRYFTVYGPAGRPDMSVFRFLRCIAEGTPLTLYGDGTQQRDFTYVDDIAAGTIAALAPVGYEIFNLGSDQPYSVQTMLDMLSELLGKTPIIQREPAHTADVPQTWADISKARRLLGWQPQVSFENGLRACAQWYVAQHALASILDLG
jgi:nucleoside-diphosphate-sugar epimerase